MKKWLLFTVLLLLVGLLAPTVFSEPAADITAGTATGNNSRGDGLNAAENGTTWSGAFDSPISQDIGPVTGTSIQYPVNGDWQNSSATVLLDTTSPPTMVVLTLANPGDNYPYPSVVTTLVGTNADANGVINKVYLPGDAGYIWDITSEPFPYTNTSLKGLRAVSIGEVIYAFYSLDAAHLAVSTISIGTAQGTQGNTYSVGNVLNTQQVSYVSEGESMATFRVMGSDDGIYLVSKQADQQGNPVLDISFIPVEELGAGGSPGITPSPVMRVGKSTNFDPVPDTNLYGTLLANYPGTGDPVIVGVSDNPGEVNSWYIDLANPGQHGQTPVYLGQPTLTTVSLFQGATPYNPAGVNDLVLVAFSSVYNSPEDIIVGGEGTVMNASLSRIGSSGYSWNTLYDNGNLAHPYFGYPGMSGNNAMCTVPQTNGTMRQSMVISGVQVTAGPKYPDIPVTYTGTLWSTVLGSNTLVPDPDIGNFNTVNFTAYGNLAIPVGIVDGVPPICLNGHAPEKTGVNSEVELVSSSTQDTETSGTTSSSASATVEGKFLEEAIGIGASYTKIAEQTTTNGTSFSHSVTDDFPLYPQTLGTSDAYLIYMAPNLETRHFWVYDYNGKPPAAGQAMDIYVTYPHTTPDGSPPYLQSMQGYPITAPPVTGWLAGAMKSPFYNDTRTWDWSSWSGGWSGRDWTQYTGSANYTVNSFGSTLDFNNGADQTTSLEMTTVAGSSHETTNKVTTDASIFGFGGSGEVSLTQDLKVSNTVDKGVTLIWEMAEPDDPSTCWVDNFVVEPVIITANAGTTTPLPWVPPAYQNYQPWLITYNLLQADTVCGAGTGSGGPLTAEVRKAVIPAGAGTIWMNATNPEKGGMVELKATPSEGYVFSHWQAFGVDLEDYTSGETSGTIKSDLSTVRAYFVTQQSDLVTDARLVLGGDEGRIDISGTIPASLTRGIALDPETPVRVVVGGKEFPFGPKAGTCTVLSYNEIYYTTNGPNGSRSTLTLDYGKGTWVFTAEGADRLGRIPPVTDAIRIGLTAKNTMALEELPLPGSQSFLWTGESGTVETSVFSFDANTRVTGSFAYPCPGPGRDSFIIDQARFNKSAFSPDQILKFKVNQLTFEFANATARNGDIFSYEKAASDCNVSMAFDTGTGIWSASLSGPRLSSTYWGDTQAVSLQMGKKTAQGIIRTGVTGAFSWPAHEAPLTAAFTGTPLSGTAPIRVSFTDTSTGTPTSWFWSFRDGSTSSEQDPVHVFEKPGRYSVFLLVKNGQDSSSFMAPDYITATKPVFLADFAVSPTSGVAPLTVKCTDKSVGSPTRYNYNFGDGTNVQGPNPGHTYKFPGTYSITETVTKYDPVTGSVTSSSTTKTNVITVGTVPFINPVANFTATPVNGTAPLAVTFTDQSTGNPTFYNYDFGDGANATGRNPVHTYRFPGVYNVTLTVLKNNAANVSVVGNSSVRYGLIMVSPK